MNQPVLASGPAQLLDQALFPAAAAPRAFSSAPAAAEAGVVEKQGGPPKGVRMLDDFFETGRKEGEKVAIGRAWEAWELRHKSFQDLHALWYVLLKEKARLYSQKEMLRSQGLRMVQPHRIPLVKKSMCRIKQVLTERALAVKDADKQWFYRKLINDM